MILESLLRPGVKGRILVVDANNMIARHGNVHPTLTAPDKRPTGAIYGTLAELSRLARNHKAKAVIMCVDAGRPAFRVEAVQRHAEDGDGYKAHRAEKRDAKREKIWEDCRAQLDYMDEVLTPLGVHIVKAKGYEADDLCGSIVRTFESERFTVVSGDKDYHQLVEGKRVQVVDPKHGPIEQPPANYVLMRAVAGDSSDNIPGIRGVGAATFIKVVEQAGLSEVTGPRKLVKELRKWAEGQSKVPKAVQAIIEGKDALVDYHAAMDMWRTVDACKSPTVKITRGVFNETAALRVMKRWALNQFRMDWDQFGVPFKKLGGDE